MLHRRHLRITLALILGSGAAAGASEVRQPLERWNLPSGLQVLAAPWDEGPTELLLLSRAGWSRDPEDGAGMAEVVLGSLTWATRSRDPQTLVDDLAEMKASLSGELGRDYAALRLSLEAGEDVENALALLGELVTDPILHPLGDDIASVEVARRTVNLRGQPEDLGDRLLPLLFHGRSAASGLPDPWKLWFRRERLRDFALANYRPDTSILVMVGSLPESRKAGVETAFAKWERPAEPPAAPSLPESKEPVIGLVEMEGPARVSFGLRLDASGLETPLARHLFLAELAGRLGKPELARRLLPPSGVESLWLDANGSPREAIQEALKALEQMEKRATGAEAFEAARDRLIAQLEEGLQDGSFAALWLALCELYGIDPRPEGQLRSLSPDDLQQAAKRIRKSGGFRAVVMGDLGLLRGLKRLGRARRLSFLGELDGPGEAEARGRAILEAAVAAQGGRERLERIRHLEERGKGVYHGEFKDLAIRWRLAVSVPDEVYYELVYPRERRFVIHRVHEGVVWMDLSGVTPVPAKLEKIGVLRRMALRRPALALLRPLELGLVRFVDTEEGGGPEARLDVIDVLDPAAGVARYWIRRSDGDLVRLHFDLVPIEDSPEEHEFSDFRLVDGVRLPHRESVKGARGPYMDLELDTILTPESIPPELFREAARPDPALFE